MFLPPAETYSVPALSEKRAMDLLFLEAAFALRAMGFPRSRPAALPPPSVRVLSKNPLKVLGVFAGSWISVLGTHRPIQMDGGRGGRKKTKDGQIFVLSSTERGLARGCSSVVMD